MNGNYSKVPGFISLFALLVISACSAANTAPTAALPTQAPDLVTPTNTPTDTPTLVPPTDTPIPTDTPVPPTATNTATATLTATPSSTATPTCTATRKPTARPKPTNTLAPLIWAEALLNGQGRAKVINNYPTPLTLSVGDKTYSIPGSTADYILDLGPGEYTWTAVATGIAPGTGPLIIQSGWNTLLAFGKRS